MATSIDKRAEILANIWMEYRDTGDFDDLIAYGDLGFPLAYAITYEIVQATDQTTALINELFDLFLESIDVEDEDFDSLEEILDTKLED